MFEVNDEAGRTIQAGTRVRTCSPYNRECFDGTVVRVSDPADGDHPVPLVCVRFDDGVEDIFFTQTVVWGSRYLADDVEALPALGARAA